MQDPGECFPFYLLFLIIGWLKEFVFNGALNETLFDTCQFDFFACLCQSSRGPKGIGGGCLTGAVVAGI
ncbi:MAG TPA: hypothetical protein DCY42_13060 [Chloroflexi bacterium]|nr:hypothetical protein [Chloroflexota bacterium]